MKKMMIAMFATIALMATAAHADDASRWALKDGPNWTSNDNVQMQYTFTEGGTAVGPATLLIGPLLGADAQRPVVTTQFVGSGRTICLTANAFRNSQPTVVVVAVPHCYTFPFGPLDAPTIIDTP